MEAPTVQNGRAVGKIKTIVLGSGRAMLFVTSTVEDLTMGNIVALARNIREELKKEVDYHYIIFNICASGYIDSTVVGFIYELRGWSVRHSGKVIIVTDSDKHMQILSATQVTKYLDVVRNTAEARKIIDGLEGILDSNDWLE